MMSKLLNTKIDTHNSVDAAIEDIHMFDPDDAENSKEELLRLLGNVSHCIKEMLKGKDVIGKKRWEGCLQALESVKSCMEEPNQDVFTLQDVIIYLIP